MGVILGIDLGTTNSVVAVDDGTAPRALRDSEGRAIQPSVVSFHPSGRVMVGQEAKDRRVIDPRNTVFSVKRLIGRSMRSREAVEMSERMPFEIASGQNELPVVKVRAGQFAIPEISALVLDHMKKIAGAAGFAAREAVITVPASFNDAQRTATATAGSIAGLEVVRVINEPTAAALAYGYRRKLRQTVAVYDFGGGTFDITILRISGDTFEVLGSAGDSFLGGEDIDALLVRHLADEFLRDQKVDLHSDPSAIQRLYAVAEKVKIELSSKSSAAVRVEEIAYGAGGAPLHLELQLSRAQLESMATELIRRTFPVCDEAMQSAGLRPSDLSDLVMVGGSTRMPLVRDLASKYFQVPARADVHPDEAVALGAALQASLLQSLKTQSAGRVTAKGVAPSRPPAPPRAAEETLTGSGDATWVASEVGTEAGSEVGTEADSEVGTEAGSEVGTEADSEVGTEAGTDVRTMSGIDADADDWLLPSSVVEPLSSLPPPLPKGPKITLLGAQAPLARVRPVKRSVPAPVDIVERGGGLGEADLEERVTEERLGAKAIGGPVILEITPYGLGIGTVGGYCEHVIQGNSRIPARATRVFCTSHSGQKTVRIRVCQGNSRKILENTLLGEVVLDGLEALPRGATQIEVEFLLDESGILKVAARDKVSGKMQNAQLRLVGAQTESQIEASQARLRELRR